MQFAAVKQNPKHPKPAPSQHYAEIYSDGNELAAKTNVDRDFLPFHSDQGATDLIALLSVTAAPKGGESKWVSSIAIHNELLRQGRKVMLSTLPLVKPGLKRKICWGTCNLVHELRRMLSMLSLVTIVDDMI